MNFVVITIFPDMFKTFWEHGIIRKALSGNKITASTINIRDFAKGNYKSIDDTPYGGGCGMVMKPDPLSLAIKAVKNNSSDSSRTVFLTPQGRVFNQKIALELASYEELILICGRYEGIDERICHEFVDEEISIGDYVLTGGEIAAMVVIDSVSRLVQGVLGGECSAEKDSFADGLLEHAHYTKPYNFEGQVVPDILLSGNHKQIEKWRIKNSLIRTFLKRPDLLENKDLNKEEIDLLRGWISDIEKIIQTKSIHSIDSLSSI